MMMFSQTPARTMVCVACVWDERASHTDGFRVTDVLDQGLSAGLGLDDGAES